MTGKTRLQVGIFVAIAVLNGLAFFWSIFSQDQWEVLDLPGFVLLTALIVIGILILIHQPGNRLAWLFAVYVALAGLSGAALGYAESAIPGGQNVRPAIAWLALFGRGSKGGSTESAMEFCQIWPYVDQVSQTGWKTRPYEDIG